MLPLSQESRPGPRSHRWSPPRWAVVLGLCLILAVVGQLVVGVAGLFAAFGWPLPWDASTDVRGAEAKIREVASPLVVHVSADVDWFDGNTLFVELVAGATDAQARDVWCSVVLPTGIDPLVVLLGPEDVLGIWEAPADCADPADVPPFEPWSVS